MLEMKKLLLLLFSLMLSFNSYGEWREISVSNESGDISYVDINSIKERDGYVYWWEMVDYLKPRESGYMSDKSYGYVNCSSMGYEYLQLTFYKHSMGSGESRTITPTSSGWHYAPSDSVGGKMLDFVCKYLK